MSTGTRTLSFMGEDYGGSESAYLVSVKEDAFHTSAGSSGSLFGVCFIDACIGTFHVRKFTNSFNSIVYAIYIILYVCMYLSPPCSCHSSVMIVSALVFVHCLLTIHRPSC